MSKSAGRGTVLFWALWRSTVESTCGDISGRLGRALLISTLNAYTGRKPTTMGRW
jgi:hypothetical protein